MSETVHSGHLSVYYSIEVDYDSDGRPMYSWWCRGEHSPEWFESKEDAIRDIESTY
jgi:hypothetical protein